MDEKSLLVITSAFPFEEDYRGIFIKEQLKQIKNYFKDISVISPLSYYPKFIHNNQKFAEFSGCKAYPNDYVSDNIKIYFPRYFPLPPIYDIFRELRGPFARYATGRVIRRESINFDIIHAHFMFPPGYIGMSLKDKFHTPLILTAHGGDIYHQPFKSRRRFDLTKKILMSADGIIATSTNNYNIITNSFKISNEKVFIIGNGFDNRLFFQIDKYRAREKLGLPLDGKIILSIGNLVAIKGHEYLISSLKYVATAIKNTTCFIIGKGATTKLQSQIERLNLAGNVKIINGVPHTEIPLWINACDVFVLPSLNEGSPTILPEVLGCGKPIVATSVGGVPEIVIDENIGLLVREKNSKELADKIILALTKEWDSKRIIEHASQYTWEIISRKIMAVYNCF